MVNEWQQTTLGDLFTVKHGFAFKGEHFTEQHQRTVLVTPGNFAIGGGFQDGKRKYYNGPIPEDYVLKPGQIVVTMTDLSKESDTLGYAARIPQDLTIWLHNQRVGLLEFKPDITTSPRFIEYLLRGHEYRSWVVGSATGTTVKHTSPGRIESFSTSIPPLEEQHAIANILGALDDKIELSRIQCETLESLAHTLFKAWFVDFEPVRAKLEGRWHRDQTLSGLPAHHYDLFPDSLVESELGKIPKGWEIISANKIIDFNPSESLRKGTEAPYIEMASLPTNGCWPEPPVSRPFGSGMRFRNGDTLLARITPCLENGKTAFVQCLPDNSVGWGSTEYIVMRTRAPVPAEFGYLLARDNAFREQAIRSMTGTSGRQRVQADSVAAYKLAVPPNEAVWNSFSHAVTPIFQNIKANAQAKEALIQLRDTLLPKLISGELRVPDAARFIGA